MQSKASKDINALIDLLAAEKQKLYETVISRVCRYIVAHAVRDKRKSTQCTKTLKLEYFWSTSLVNLENSRNGSLC